MTITLRLTVDDTETLIAALGALEGVLTKGVAQTWIEPLRQNLLNQLEGQL